MSPRPAPDGCTLLLNSITTHGIGPHLYTSLPYNSVKGFTPIIFVANLPLVMTVYAERPEDVGAGRHRLRQDQSRASWSFASSGNGGAPHLSGELLQNVAGIKMLHVPYRGSGPAVIDVGAGEVDIMFDAVPSLLALIPACKLRPLAAASAARNPIVPDVPTFGELGIKGMEISLWYRHGRPAEPAAADRAAAQYSSSPRFSRSDEVKESFAKQGADLHSAAPPRLCQLHAR